jgi:hypothetical protein
MKTGKVTRAAGFVAVVALVTTLGCGSSSPTAPAANATAVFIHPDRVLIGPGDREVMFALAAFPTGEPRDVSATARWESSNTAVVTMDGNEAVGVGPGEAEIRVVLGTVSATQRVTVFAPSAVSQFSSGVPGGCWPGETVSVTVYGTLTNGEPITPTNVLWQSDDPGIATITTKPTPRGAYSGHNGTITCRAAGVTRLHATYLGRTVTRELTVRVPLDTIEARGSSSVRNGNTLTHSESVFYVLDSAPSARIEFATRRVADPSQVVAASSQTV